MVCEKSWVKRVGQPCKVRLTGLSKQTTGGCLWNDIFWILKNREEKKYDFSTKTPSIHFLNIFVINIIKWNSLTPTGLSHFAIYLLFSLKSLKNTIFVWNWMFNSHFNACLWWFCFPHRLEFSSRPIMLWINWSQPRKIAQSYRPRRKNEIGKLKNLSQMDGISENKNPR